jgi:glycosyltransferase involved in cell wall biosynthesis
MKSERPRIALVAGGLEMGGATTFLVNFSGELVRRGIPVEVITFEQNNPMGPDFQARNVPVICWPDRKVIFEDRMKAVLRELAGFQPTVVISTLGGNSFEVLRYLQSGIFRIAMGQSDDPIVYKTLELYAPWTDLLAMVSRRMKDHAAALSTFARVPVEYLPLGVPMCPASELPSRDFSAPLRILYLGRVCQEQKRVRLFPEILRQLCASGMPFRWTIAGEGDEREFLEANLKSASPLQTVSFTRHVRYDEVPALLKKHDIFLLTSDYEGLPLSLLEAMGHGLVPVVSDLKSGIPEVVDKTNGIVVSVDDVAGYARAIIHLHENRIELSAKSVAARTRVEREFSVGAMTDRWLAAIPLASSSIEKWPKSWSIKAPLEARVPLYFFPPMRVLRRMAVKLRL